MSRRSFLPIALLLASSAASADIISKGPDSVAVALYHDGPVDTSDLVHPSWNMLDDGLAFITETRTVDLPAGPAVLKLRGVTSTMVPQTADIQGLSAGVIERNFDYDLLSPGSLLAKSIGKTVRLVRTDPKTGKSSEEMAIVRSGPDGAMLQVGNKYEALRCSGLPERLVFDHEPEGLADKPTLSIRTNSPKAGRYTIKLSYIATGLNWSADYVARLIPGTDRLALTGWLTLANFSSTSFPRVPLDVIAGNLSTTGDDNPVHPAPIALARHCWPMNIDWATHHLLPPPPPPPPPAPMMAVEQDQTTETVVVTGSRMPSEYRFGDYKLYRLPEPTTLAAQQTKQIRFLDQPDVHFERLYSYRNSVDSDNEPIHGADIIYRLQNRVDRGLGRSLPAGSISVFEKGPEGEPVFVGQASIHDKGVGLPLELTTGAAVDVRVEAHVAKYEKSGTGKSATLRSTWDVTMENDKAVPIVFEAGQYLFNGTGKISEETEPHDTRYGNALWTFHLAAGERKVLHYTVEHLTDY